MIMADEIDILVDLTGHTAGNRLDVMALKPAPVQVTYIGYPNTTGLPTIDYRFADAVTDPLDSQQRYVEELVRLPHCFLCYTPSPDAGPVAPAPCTKNGYITFGSFNNLAKRMVIKCKPFACDTIRNNFLRRLQDEGIEPARVDLLALIPLNHDHLQAYSYMDISLDTFPYAGTTTTCEALWMGVPVITLTGDNHAHNVGATILQQVGHEELIARTKESYVQAALRLASDVQRLHAIRRYRIAIVSISLREKMQSSYLCNPREFTRNLEDTYSRLWRKHCLQHVELSAVDNQGQPAPSSEPNTTTGPAKKVKITTEGTELDGGGGAAAAENGSHRGPAYVHPARSPF
ncbi:udpn-acetylglucosamine--peptide n-acetylglucosaminyltransferase spindly, putative [Acanthamoeba castellanii str. Neff]|uniref:Udpn-acetylglucosamine--peptide n-acetylglucosaminyltransferase spindly, putative n=1 Tax=Acanthamoeba castellanii (strain ATCC 30010 / Neff) TaxID=1257118 RepID=L8GQ71_ACACF|nr:udpn-acetylglucosamine--peptide n-acetylglucosaminyltransferase spindly, putative [Acanthamoeba castellanii str. Neff]ELR15334.1 udpn-acetylglucosamine--peptide n-acetylglucosaminyltransferase spindly, putative [Acanthamoeba castellanii str. Neff]